MLDMIMVWLGRSSIYPLPIAYAFWKRISQLKNIYMCHDVYSALCRGVGGSSAIVIPCVKQLLLKLCTE